MPGKTAESVCTSIVVQELNSGCQFFKKLTVTGKTAPKFGVIIPAITNITECCTKEVQLGVNCVFLFGGVMRSAKVVHIKERKEIQLWHSQSTQTFRQSSLKEV